jgi:hypothetical protein
MKRVLWTIMAAVALCPLHAPAGSPAPPQAVVRLYPDGRTDPRGYVSANVPVERFEVKAEAIRSAYARSRRADAGATAEKLEGAIVVVAPADQQDQVVIDMLGDLILARFLTQGSLALRPADSVQVPRKPYLFLDTLNQPVPNAEVEVLLGWSGSVGSTPAAQVWIADARLDTHGCLPPPGSILTANRFIFRVRHPDCGLVPALPESGSEDGSRRVWRVAALPKDQWCVFLDALGYPMAGVRVEIITSGSWEHGRMTFLDPIFLDRGGRLPPPAVFTTLQRCSFVVSDPNYGMALVEPYSLTRLSPQEPLRVCVVPLIASGTPADAGAIWGIVADSDGICIPGAIVACRRIRVPSGWLEAYWPWTAQPGKEAKVLTDDRGRFALRLPFAAKDGALGSTLPRGAMYEVTVTPPAELGCQPYAGRLAAGREHVVILEGTLYGPKKYSGLLRFEDERGPVTDPAKIVRVNLTIQVRRANFPPMTHSYRQGEWLENSQLPFGRYEATADWDGKHYLFGGVMVTAESPGVIVFRPVKVERFEAYYRGRVVDGINGSPIAGAIIIPSSAGSPRPDFADPQLDPGSDAFRRLEQQLQEPIVRTDRFGRFEMTLPVATKAGSTHLIAVKKDYFPFRQPRARLVPGRQGGPPRRLELPADKEGKVLLPDMKLFPAGTVVIEPNLPDECRGRSAALELLAADARPAAWLTEFLSAADDSSRGSVVRRTDPALHGRQGIRVPASVRMALRVQLPDERYAPALIEEVLVTQGETLDLGRLDFTRAVPILVKVIDAAGGPAEGVTVRSLLGKGGYPGPEAVTDANGIARLRAAANSEARLVLERNEPETGTAIRAEMVCRVAGPEDAGREFVLPLPVAAPAQPAESRPMLSAPGERDDK